MHSAASRQATFVENSLSSQNQVMLQQWDSYLRSLHEYYIANKAAILQEHDRFLQTAQEYLENVNLETGNLQVSDLECMWETWNMWVKPFGYQSKNTM